MSDATLGLWLGLVGVTVFALTLPMTRLATGTVDAPQLSPWFVTWARAALAGGLSALFLLATRSRLPTPAERGPLLLSLAGNAIGYPLLLGWALRHVSSGHAAVITALLPLATAAVAAWLLHQRARLGFWLFAALGSALVVVYSLLRAWQAGALGGALGGGVGGHGFGLVWADALLVGAVMAAALGYVGGAKVTPTLGAERVISWVCVIALPLTVPGALLTWPDQPINLSAWLALAYVGVFSMWAGFFAWFRGLALGGALRVSQLQLLQPFISILAAVPLLGESLDALTLGFALAV
ncbi:MAG: EamA family transporter, partial [Comamonadaceae bacterium]|nr:EamA family transporter [Comamonadaceae bacterium]